jgi:peroxiredoxin
MSYKSLGDRFAELQAERAKTWKPEQLARNAGQRRALVERHDPAAYPQPGDAAPDFTVIDQDGAELTRDALTARGPAVLVFFRFAGCPACNLALPYYNETLAPQLARAGIPLVAVSAQNPVDRGIIDRHGLRFSVAGDPGYALGRALGITFLPEEQRAVAPGDSWIGATLGTDSYEIDQPAVLILDQGGTVRWLDVSPDWLDRTESYAILAQLPEVGASQVRTEVAA